MYTQCPNCDTYFRLTPDQLRAAGGQVRCGVCDTTFNALETIQDALPQQPARVSETPRAPTRNRAAEDGKPRTDKSGPTRQQRKAQKVEERTARKAEKAARKHGGSATAGTPTGTGRRVMATAGWFVANLLLIAIFPMQFVYFERDMLATEYPELRPHLEQVCGHLGCSISPQRDPEAIEISRRDVRAHPEVDGALLIHAQLVNRADFAQPYPELHLVLSDLREQPMAQRRFLAGEYLDERHDPDEFMRPGASAHITLAVQDPGDDAINFRFDLY